MSSAVRLAIAAFISIAAADSYAKDAGRDEFQTVMVALSTQENMQAAALEIQAALPDLTLPERKAVFNQLRPYGATSFTALGLIVDADMASSADRVRFISMASLHFARLIERYDMPGPQNPLWFPARKMDHAIGNTLKRLSVQLRAGDSQTRAEFEKAIANTHDDRPFAYKRSNRLLFFEMFEDGSLNWTDHSLWLIRAGNGGASRRFELRSQYKVEGNVIRPRAFKGRCEDPLD